MTLGEYQRLARRTQKTTLIKEAMLGHALAGMVSEVGEIHSLFQHQVQNGVALDEKELSKEIGDLLWFIGELCDVYGFDMDQIAGDNIAKLKRRYPEGFDEERSIHRHEFDSNA